MVENNAQGKIPYEDFFRQAIVNLRDLSKSRGIHTVFSNFNRTFREYYGEDPVKITQQLASEGKIEIKPVPRGVMIYLPGEGPVYKGTSTDQTLAKILGQTTKKEASMIEQVIGEVVPDGVKTFPEDFLEKILSEEDYITVQLPSTPLKLAPGSDTLVISPRRHFRYETSNPSIAKYILYSYQIGENSINIPKSNRVIFKATVQYEQYTKDISELCFELFLRRSNDEGVAESLTKEALKKLGIRTMEQLQ